VWVGGCQKAEGGRGLQHKLGAVRVEGGGSGEGGQVCSTRWGRCGGNAEGSKAAAHDVCVHVVCNDEGGARGCVSSYLC
jgi:hypothetical protein